MRVKVDKKSKEVLLSIQKIPDIFYSGLWEGLADLGAILVKEEVRLERKRNKTGRLYNGIRASAPGEVPQRRTGRLSKSTDYSAHSSVLMSFGQKVKYADYLANGTKKMKKRGNLIQAVKNKKLEGILIMQEYINRELGI